MLGEKLKKLRMDNGLTQDELAEKILVTRTAVSKWETNKGYPSIDSLKELSNLFGVTIDELIADDDIENKRLLDQAESHKYYRYAIGCFCVATVSAAVSCFVKASYLTILSISGVIGYVVFSILAKQKYRRLPSKKTIVPYGVSRLVVLAIVIIVIVTTMMQM